MTIDHKYGVPTVAFHTQPFERVVRSVTQLNGMPRMRQVFVPQPVMGKTPQQLRAYIDGKDPITDRPVMQEVIEGLTSPLDAADLKDVTFEMIDHDLDDELDAAYGAKYRRYGPGIVGSTLTPQARLAALRLVPRSPTSANRARTGDGDPER